MDVVAADVPPRDHFRLGQIQSKPEAAARELSTCDDAENESWPPPCRPRRRLQSLPNDVILRLRFRQATVAHEVSARCRRPRVRLLQEGEVLGISIY